MIKQIETLKEIITTGECTIQTQNIIMNNNNLTSNQFYLLLLLLPYYYRLDIGDLF